ncbi:hypothetical protein KY335_04885 [Candidatus Woesearchaeota archaeon]|nr:hypothetical protein [Candidatus Woesearchaeota archaeon]
MKDDTFVEKMIYAFVGTLLGMAIGTGMGLYVIHSSCIRSSKIDIVQEDYIAPSKIEEIICEDLDQNGEKETMIKIDGKSYLLKYNAEGKPTIYPYKIKVETHEQQE